MCNRTRKFIDNICNLMKVGQYRVISREIFNKSYPCGFPTIYRNHMEAFLSTKVGSSWGGWKVEQNPETGDYIISRHKETDKRVYIDPDREHLFTKMSDGSLQLKENKWI